jgi:hypothetical protein
MKFETLNFSAMNKKQLAALYKVSPKIFRIWLKPILPKLGNIEGRVLTPKQVRIIIDHLGEP